MFSDAHLFSDSRIWNRVNPRLETAERLPNIVMRGDLSSVGREAELRIRAKIRRDLLRLQFIYTIRICLQYWVGRLKLGLDLLPGISALCGHFANEQSDKQNGKAR